MVEQELELDSQQQQAAANITAIYQQLFPENVVSSLLADNSVVEQWLHYPKGDIKDFNNHIQYYYHSHPSTDQQRVHEHGHFHVFFRANKFADKAVEPVITSNKYQQSHGKKDNLSHLFAIAMDQYGFPKALFTVNYWVTLGVWYDAATLTEAVDEFYIASEQTQYATTNDWLNNLVVLFKPQIKELLEMRDQTLKLHPKSSDGASVYYDKSLEITSAISFATSL